MSKLVSLKALRSALDTIDEACFICNKNMAIRYANSSACDIFGYTAGNFEGKRLHNLFPSSKQQEAEQLIHIILEQESDDVIHRNPEGIYALRKNGEEFPIELSARRIENGFLLLLKDITAELKLELSYKNLIREFEQSNKHLKDLDTQKDHFIGMAAHDLRTPLHRIVAATDLLSNQGLQEDRRESLLDMIMRAAQGMLGIIDDLLNIAKIESGQVQLRKRPVQIKAYIESIVEQHALLAQNRNIKLISEISKNPGEMVADPDRLGQVFSNLLSNAFKFTGEGTSVTITAERKRGDIVFSVSDQGPGIPENEIGEVFEAFQQISTQPETGEQGTGLGLAICKRIVELHEGSIKVDEGYVGGARFVFTIPIFSDEEEAS